MTVSRRYALTWVALVGFVAAASQLSGQSPNYPCNRPPLASQKYVKLPL